MEEDENPDAAGESASEDEQAEQPEVEDIISAEQDELAEKAEFQGDVAEKQAEDFYNPYPQESQKDSIYTFFREILGLEDSSKVANLDKRELGNLNFSVRNYEYLSMLGKIFNNKSYENFFRNSGEIVLATSMSKRGWLPELVVSQKRFSQRTVNPVKPLSQKKGFLGLVKSEGEQQ